MKNTVELIATTVAVGMLTSTALAAPVLTPAGEDFAVNSHTVSGQYEPKVAMAADGSYVGAWYSLWMSGDYTYDIAVRLFDADGNPRGEDFIANSYTAGDQEDHSVDMTPDGRFVVTWSGEGLGVQNGIWARAFAADGRALFDDKLISASAEANRPQVAVDDVGNLVVVWSEGDNLYAQRVDARGRLDGPALRVNAQHPGVNQFRTRAAMGPDGRFAVVWAPPNVAPSTDSRVSYYAADNSLLLSEAAIATARNGQTRVGVQRDGSLQVTWMSDSGLHGRFYDPAGNLISEDVELHQTAGPLWEMDMDVDGTGVFALTWRERDPDDASLEFLLTARWGADGSPVDAPFITNTDVYPWFGWPTVALTPGDMVVLWNSDGADDGDIFGRRFVIEDPFYEQFATTIEDMMENQEIQDSGFGNTLLRLLGNAQVLATSDADAALAQLEAMVARIERWPDRKISEAAADELVSALEAFMATLDG